MNKDILTEKDKNEIIQLFINTNMTIRKIAENTGTTVEQVYEILNKYFKDNGINSISRSKNGVKIENNEINTKLLNMREIKEWINKNGRRPRTKIARVKAIQNEEKEMEVEEELRLGYTLNAIIHNMMRRYGSIDLGKIEDEEDREIVQIIREINIRYGKNRTACLLNAREIEDWVEKNGRKPRKQIKGVKTTQNIENETEEQREIRLGNALYRIVKNIINIYEGVNLEEIQDEQDREIIRIIRKIDSEYENNKRNRTISLLNAREIKDWIEENARKPRMKIRGVKTVQNIEEETKEQRELRLGHALNCIRTRIMNKYESMDLNQIKNKDEREIVRIIREIDSKYENNKLGRKKKVEISNDENIKQELGKAIWNLLKTRNATVEQIKIIADYYGVNLEEIEFSQVDNDNNDFEEHEERE